MGHCDEPNVERLFAAFEHRETDRVPNFEILIEDQHVLKLLGRDAGNTLGAARGAAEKYAEKPIDPREYIAVCKLIGQDAIGLEALWVPLRKADEDGVYHVVSDGSVHTWEDLAACQAFSYERDIAPRKRYLEEYIAAAQGTKIGVTLLTGCLFQSAYQFIVGYENFMAKLYEDREFIERVLDICADYYEAMVQAAVDAGITHLYVADDVGYKPSMMVNPKLFRGLWVPRYERILAPAQRKGLRIHFHSDGMVEDLIPMLLDLGILSLNPIEPAADWNIYDLKKKWGDKICLHGNIDMAGVLGFGTPGEVDADVREHVEKLGPGGGYVLSSCHSIMNHIPHENFLAMVAAGHKYGQYPIGSWREKPDAYADCWAAERLRELQASGEQVLVGAESSQGFC